MKLCKLAKWRHNDVIVSNFGPPRNQMKLIFLESTWQELSKNTIFIDFGQILQKLRQYKFKTTTFGMGSFQLWSYHVTHVKNLSFSYLESYSPLNLRKSHQMSWFCCISIGSYKEDNLKEGRICPPPPPMWNRVKINTPVGSRSRYLPFKSPML